MLVEKLMVAETKHVPCARGHTEISCFPYFTEEEIEARGGKVTCTEVEITHR